jgi:hypothetical protein
VLAGLVQPAGGVGRYPQVPQRLGLGPLVAGLGRQPVRPLQVRYGDLVVTPDELVQTTDPEQRLTLTPGVTQRAVQLESTREQR